MTALRHNVPRLGEFVLGQARKAVFAGPQVYLDDDTQIVQQSRDSSPGDDVGVGHADHFRHDEGCGAHDGRQQLPAYRG